MALTQLIETINDFVSNFPEKIRLLGNIIVQFFTGIPPWLQTTLKITFSFLIILMTVSLIIFMFKRKNAWMYKM